MLYITFFRDSIFAKLAWTIFWIPKCNSCRKFIYRITFFALAGNAVPYTWSNKGNSFNTRLHTLSRMIFQLFKKKKNSRCWTKLNPWKFKWKVFVGCHDEWILNDMSPTSPGKFCNVPTFYDFLKKSWSCMKSIGTVSNFE